MPFKGILYFLVRALVSVHFISELYDKLVRFDYWSDQIKGSMGYGDWSLWLVISLLFVGSFLLVIGKYLPVSFLALCLFQVPTSIFFERGDLYDQCDSVSALGGVLAVAFYTSEIEVSERQKQELEILTDINVNGGSFGTGASYRENLRYDKLSYGGSSDGI